MSKFQVQTPKTQRGIATFLKHHYRQENNRYCHEDLRESPSLSCICPYSALVQICNVLVPVLVVLVLVLTCLVCTCRSGFSSALFCDFDFCPWTHKPNCPMRDSIKSYKYRRKNQCAHGCVIVSDHAEYCTKLFQKICIGQQGLRHPMSNALDAGD